MEFIAIISSHDAVGAEDRAVEKRLLDRRVPAQQVAVAVDACAGHAVQALGNVQALELQHRLGAGRGREPFPAIAKAVLRVLIAVTPDMEEQLPVHQSRLAKRHPPVAVGVIAKMIDRLKLDQRNAAAGPGIHHADGEPPG